MDTLNFWEGATILSVRKGKDVVIAGDGQLTAGSLILKANVKKVRRLGNGDVLVGFTGSTADAVILFEKLESAVAQNPHQLIRACVELAKFWRKEPLFNAPNAMMIVVNEAHSLVLTGEGEVFEKEDGIIGVGAGGPFALAAARALLDQEGLSAKQIVEKAMEVAAEVCVYTNANIVFEELTS